MENMQAEKQHNCWNYEDIDESTAEIRFYGPVMDKRPVDFWTGEPAPGEYITPEGLKEDLEKAKNKKVLKININSGGGNAYTGLAIHNVLKSLVNVKKVVTVDGMAASAASVIAMAGDVINVYPGSLIMIHNVKAGLMDFYTKEELKTEVRAIEALESASAAIYAEKTGLDTTTIRNMMDKETWLTGAEAVNKGFADQLAQDGKFNAFMESKNRLMLNGVEFNLEKLHVPQAVLESLAPAAPIPTVTNKNNEKENTETMELKTIEDLKAQAPALLEQVQNEAAVAAVMAERERLQGIDEIANTIGDAELINAAKFGEKPMNAAELALAAMKKAAAAGEKFMQERKAETAPAAAVPAINPPKEDKAALEKMEQEKQENAINNVVDIVKNLK